MVLRLRFFLAKSFYNMVPLQDRYHLFVIDQILRFSENMKTNTRFRLGQKFEIS